MKKKKDEITIRSSAAEYLTYVASVGDQQDSIEMRYEDEILFVGIAVCGLCLRLPRQSSFLKHPCVRHFPDASCGGIRVAIR